MNLAVLMAIRVQGTLDELRALKARDRADIAAEERLQARLGDAMALLLDRVSARLEEGPPPADPVTARRWLGELVDLEDQILDILFDEVGDEAAAAIEAVEQFVAAKGIPDALRAFGMDRRLFQTLNGLRDRVLGRLVTGTIDRLVAGAASGIDPDQLRLVLEERISGELSQISRHVLGDVRAEATEVAERSLGVTHHRWVTAGDESVRPAHAAVDGEVARLGEPFSNGWLRPGGLGCRCWLEPETIAA